MATSRDNYVYEVVYSPRGFEQVPANAVKLHHFEEAMKDVAASAERVGPAGKKAADGLAAAGAAAQGYASRVDAAAANGGKLGAAMGRIGPAMLSFSQLAEDAQYGVRGLANNVPFLISALGGFTPQAQLAAGAASLVTIAFRDQIDAGLAWAGVLDENVVKGMERGEAAAKSLTDRLAQLRAEFEESAKPQQEQSSAISQAFADAGKDAERSVAEMIAALDGGQAEIDRKQAELTAKIAELEKRRAEAIAGGGAGVGAIAQNYAREIGRANEELLKLADGLSDAGLPALQELQREAVKSDAALLELARAARAAGEHDLAKQLYAMSDGAKAAAKATEEAAKEVEELDRRRQQQAEADARRTEQEVERRRREAEAAEEAAARKAEAEEQAQQRMLAAIDEARKQKEAMERDEAVNRVLGALGGRFDQGIGQALMGRARAGQEMGAVGVGGAADAIHGQVQQMLVRSGVGVDAANAAARQLVEEQAAAVQGIVDQNNLTFNLMQTMLNGQGQLGLAQQQHRDRMLQLQRQAEQQRRRFQPMRFMQGNNLAGRW